MINYIESQAVSDKMIFKVFLYRYIGKISPDCPHSPLHCLVWPCFLMNNEGLNNLGRESTKEHFCHIILKSVQWFLTRKFLKLLFWLPWQPESCKNTKSLNNFQSESYMDHSCEIWFKFAEWFRRRCQSYQMMDNG